MEMFFSHNVSGPNTEDISRLESLVSNVLVSRTQLFQQMLGDSRRSINDECGFPNGSVSSEYYQELFDRDSVAARVVEVLARESWRATPCVYELKNPNRNTAFEKAWDALGQSLMGETCWYQDEEGSPIWEYLRRVDELCGIGRYGVILLGIDDGLALSQPVRLNYQPYPTNYVPQPGTDAQYMPTSLLPTSQNIPTSSGNDPITVPRSLLFMRVFPESLAPIASYETNIQSPRFGHPTSYRITLTDPRNQDTGLGASPPGSTVLVHWTRVIHVADNLVSSEIGGIPRMQQVLNNLLGLRKLYGASPESYWKSCFTGLSLETHPQLGGNVNINREKLTGMMENFQNSLQKYLVLTGMSAKSLAPTVVDPTNHVATQLEAICIKLGVPLRIFKGSERGELSSTMDDEAWNSRIHARQVGHVTVRVVVPFVDRLIAIGVLPKPQKGYSVDWPRMDSLTDKEKAEIATSITTALARYVRNSVWMIMAPLDYLTIVCRFDEEIAIIVLANLEKFISEKGPLYTMYKELMDSENKVGSANRKTSAPAKYTNDSGSVGSSNP